MPDSGFDVTSTDQVVRLADVAREDRWIDAMDDAACDLAVFLAWCQSNFPGQLHEPMEGLRVALLDFVGGLSGQAPEAWLASQVPPRSPGDEPGSPSCRKKRDFPWLC